MGAGLGIIFVFTRKFDSKGSIPFLPKYLAIGNRGYKTEVRLRGLS